MSVPFYIWQVQRTEPNYQFDNEHEFNGLKEMFALYETTENPCQYKIQIENLLSKIEEDYKYKSPKTADKPNQKKKK